MEILLIIIGLAFIVWAFDFDKPIREMASMANREIAVQNAAHKTKAVKSYAKLEISAAEISKAKKVQAQLDSFDI